MTEQSPALKMEARANREQAKLVKVRHDLAIVAATIQHSELPAEVKLRLMGALRAENDLLVHTEAQLTGMRKAAQVSRGPQWVTQSDPLT